MSSPVSRILSPEERMSLARSVITSGSTWGSGKVSGKILLPSEGSTSSAACSLVGRLVAAGASRQAGGGGWGGIEGVLFRGHPTFFRGGGVLWGHGSLYRYKVTVRAGPWSLVWGEKCSTTVFLGCVTGLVGVWWEGV